MTPRPNASDPDDKSTSPFHSRPTNRQQTTLYKPTAYTFTCRGGFHIKSQKKNEHEKPSNEEEVDLETQLRDTYICNGIETKLRHVADYPLARSKDEATRWFEGANVASELHTKSSDENTDRKSVGKENKSAKKQGNQEQDDETFSSYGTTKVNILTVQEVPVIISEKQSDVMDPFSGFGPLSPSGMMNPFGSMFGGFFGGGAFDPWTQTMEDGQDESHNRGGWMRGSRSVSTSTRMGRDENGKRISTTVKKTTVVDTEGNRKTEKETTIRHLDDGGRVEKTKEIYDETQNSKEITNSSQNLVQRSDERKTLTSSPTTSSENAAPINQATKSPKVAMIATDCRLGVAITDSRMDNRDPNLPNLGDADKWRKTEYFFKLGRLLPTLGIVSQYYSEKDQQHQYTEQRQREKKNRWDKSVERDEAKTGKTDGLRSNFPIPSDLPDTSRTKYYMNRLGDQMEKNLIMMKLFVGEMIKPDFPKKVYYSGQKIADNMGPTAERAGKLMKDVFNMWFGGSLGWSGGEEGGRKR